MIDSLRFFSAAVVLTAVIHLSSIDTSAQDWTRFRGPNGNGVVEGTNFPTEWSEDDYAWQTELPGQGHSSVVTYGGRGFLMSGDPADCDSTRTGHRPEFREDSLAKKLRVQDTPLTSPEQFWQ